MTGTDPAILAAQRAWESEGWGGPGRPLEEGMSEGNLAKAAAREALAPIRDLHKRHRDLEWDGEWSDPYCQTCAHEFYGDLCYQPWPCTTAKLVYSTEELENPDA